ncbi:hypothetical protein FQA39_LY12930 [Lamprigera yunnana]|nr:hypothetical protein FQA39_LY12930 [Lamprigera yunnana]
MASAIFVLSNGEIHKKVFDLQRDISLDDLKVSIDLFSDTLIDTMISEIEDKANKIKPNYLQNKSAVNIVTKIGNEVSSDIDDIAILETEIKLNNSSRSLTLVGPKRVDYAQASQLINILLEILEESTVENDDSKKETEKSKKTSSSNDQVKKLKHRVKELEDELEYQNKLKNADIANLTKKRIEKETDLRKFAAANLASDLVKPIDLLKKVLEMPTDNPEVRNYLMGFEMISNQLSSALENHGITRMDIKVGEEFNPTFHEATEMVEDGDLPSNAIVEILGNGYMIHDRVLVHALVKVKK